ncbi:MAG: dihydrolipoyl dehydrogenase [Gammaproteobacteria bacterium]|nr:dihydrolipoyl dehydrogenase [Gammaproteobacteria bacterium]
MENSNYDVIVIGAGPAGYVCAIRCAQLGLSVACVDAWSDKNNKPSPGGTCLNVGCIPSKALLDSSHHYSFIEKNANEHGIETQKCSIDIAKMLQRKNKIVKTLTTGVKGLLKKNKVTFIHGNASIESSNEVQVSNNDSKQVVKANSIVIATGSKPFELDFLPIDQVQIVDSTGALELKQVPKHLGVIGAGVIGLEMASVWSRLGAEVTIWEAEDQFLPAVDTDIAAHANKIISNQGLDVQLNSKVQAVSKRQNSVVVSVQGPEGESQTEIDCLLVAIGRKANTESLGLNALGVSIDSHGFIEVDRQWKTNIDGIYAIGDVIGGAMLAHKGSEEGIAVAEQLANHHGHVNYNAIPWVIYTWPEIAWVGKTEQQLKIDKIDYKTGSFPFMALGRARALGDTEGVIKFIADAISDRLLGVHIIGPNASELIAEAVLAIESDLTAEDLALTIHGHPTLSEGLHEAALDLHGRAIHF